MSVASAMLAPISEMADVGHAPQEAQMSTGDERLDAVEDRIDEAKEAADRVEDNEGLGLRHPETDQPGTFEPSGDDWTRGRTRARGTTREPRTRPRSGDRRARRPQPGAGSAPAARLTSARRCSRKARSAAFAVSSIARRYD